MSIIGLKAYAHAPNEAFFDLFESEQKWLIKAEFPWTIRNVLLEKFPDLETAKTREEMEMGFLTYLQEHIQLVGENNQIIPLQKIRKLPSNNGHGHSSVYMLVFESSKTIKFIKNTCMFDAYSNQKNFHTLELSNKEQIEFVTSQEKPNYSFNSKLPIFPIIILSCLLLLLYLWLVKLGQKTILT